jgi:hypothetical protein
MGDAEIAAIVGRKVCSMVDWLIPSDGGLLVLR